MARSRSRMDERCSSRRISSSLGSPLRSNAPSLASASRMLRLRLTQPKSLAPNSRSNRRCGISSGGNGRFGPAQLMFFWIAPPNDSCETPICSDRNRELPPILRRQDLVERRSARTRRTQPRAGHQRAQRLRVTGAAIRVVQPAQDQDVVLQRGRSGSGTA